MSLGVLSWSVHQQWSEEGATPLSGGKMLLVSSSVLLNVSGCQRRHFLFLDNRCSHVSIDVAKENGVLSLSFPPSAPWGSSKSYESWMRSNSGKTLTVYDVPAIVTIAYPLAGERVFVMMDSCHILKLAWYVLQAYVQLLDWLDRRDGLPMARRNNDFKCSATIPDLDQSPFNSVGHLFQSILFPLGELFRVTNLHLLNPKVTDRHVNFDSQEMKHIAHYQ